MQTLGTIRPGELHGLCRHKGLVKNQINVRLAIPGLCPDLLQLR